MCNHRLLLDNIPTQKDISGYNTAEYDGFWWLGCVLETQLECQPIKVNFLHPHEKYGPAPSFSYPVNQDIFEIDAFDVLTSATPLMGTATGRTFIHCTCVYMYILPQKTFTCS